MKQAQQTKIVAYKVDFLFWLSNKFRCNLNVAFQMSEK